MLILTSAGIEEKKPLSSDVHVFDTDKAALQDGFKYSDLFDSVKVIPLDNASFLLASIHRFDRDGNFIHRIGSRGIKEE